MIRLDHLVVAARTLAEGVAYVEARLGVPMGPGGRHDAMGTHNRALALGAGCFLEVIAIDPEAAPPGRPRWFELDEPAMRARLARGPALIHWVARTDAIEADAPRVPGCDPEILALSRGDFRWKIGVPASGRLARSGIAPTLIQWLTRHPAQVLPDSGCRLEALVLRHPQAAATLRALRAAGWPGDDPVQARDDGLGLEARILAPKGLVELRE